MTFLIAWWDLVLITLAFSIPPALLTTNLLMRVCGRSQQRFLVASAFTGVIVLAICWSRTDDWMSDATLARQVCQSFSVYLLTLGILLVSAPPALKRAKWTSRVARGFLTLLVLLFSIIVPYTYSLARCEVLATVITELLEQSRLVEANEFAKEIVLIHPSQPIGTMTADRLNRELDSTIRELRRAISRPLYPHAPPAAQFQRARMFGMLGERKNALRVLSRLHQMIPNDPRPILLAATLEEHSRHWQNSHHLYAQAYELCKQEPQNENSKTFAAQAMRGMGFTDRHSGQIERADEEYQKLIEIAPTAENHLLAAKFYQTYQRPTEARYHARKARKLSPAQYAKQADQILSNLQTSHFSCWSNSE